MSVSESQPERPRRSAERLQMYGHLKTLPHVVAQRHKTFAPVRHVEFVGHGAVLVIAEDRSSRFDNPLFSGLTFFLIFEGLYGQRTAFYHIEGYERERHNLEGNLL